MSLKLSTVFFVGLAFCLSMVFYISLPPVHSVSKERNIFRINKSRNDTVADGKKSNYHNLAILVPFRDRFEELLEFVPHIHDFMNKKNNRHHIFVINQVDNLRFNRASLLNAGFMEVPVSYDYVALHDVDLLPINMELQYLYPRNGPYHVASPYLHPRYHYPTFIGGILLISRKHFKLVNGMSNKYWGWGLEDDEFYARVQEAKLKIYRPDNFTTGTKDTFKHIHNRNIRKRDMIKCYNQQRITRKRDRQTGLSTTRYKVQSRKDLTIDGAPVTIINMELECNYDITPWCNCTENIGNTRFPSIQYESKSEIIVPKINRKIHISSDG